MDSPSQPQPLAAESCHVVAVPYPGRGHINPMMDICGLLASRSNHILITFVLTQEWLGLIDSDQPRPANFRFATLPNGIIPSELGRGANFAAFFEAANNNLELPFEYLLDNLDNPPHVILADTFLKWAVDVGNRRNIHVASLWTESASVFSFFHHSELIRKNGHLPAILSERGDERIDYIPGVPSTRLADLPTIFNGSGRDCLPIALECVSSVSRVQFLLLTSFHELEPVAVEAMRLKLSMPVYPVGPTIPYYKLSSEEAAMADYISWLDSQPQHSVLYVSLGSFLSVSNAQLDEIVAGISDSGVPFLWVARGANAPVIAGSDGHKGFVVPWCNQLQVLCHRAIGCFWTHCGFNSTLEAIYAGVPMLTCPIFWDQTHNSKQIVEDWKIGIRVDESGSEDTLIKRQKITQLVRKLMNPKSEEGMEMRRKAAELRRRCMAALARGGSSSSNLEAFIRDITRISETRS